MLPAACSHVDTFSEAIWILNATGHPRPQHGLGQGALHNSTGDGSVYVFNIRKQRTEENGAASAGSPGPPVLDSRSPTRVVPQTVQSTYV